MSANRHNFSMACAVAPLCAVAIGLAACSLMMMRSTVPVNESLLTRPLTGNENSSLARLEERFYLMVRAVEKSACKSGAMVGGRWVEYCSLNDGQKFVCSDGIDPDGCLVYSFGAGNEVSFESEMARRGCTVRLFDHTIGLGDQTRGNLMTLKDIMNKFGDADKEISYLKVDAEGAELTAVKDWIDSGALENVRQIGVELHTDPVHMIATGGNFAATFANLIGHLQTLRRTGFRIISYEGNPCVPLSDRRPYERYFELVLYRPRKDNK